jgi:hypothetical protein
MDPGRALRSEPAGNQQRVVAVGPNARVVALLEANHAPVEEIDGGKQLER